MGVGEAFLCIHHAFQRVACQKYRIRGNAVSFITPSARSARKKANFLQPPFFVELAGYEMTLGTSGIEKFNCRGFGCNILASPKYAIGAVLSVYLDTGVVCRVKLQWRADIAKNCRYDLTAEFRFEMLRVQKRRDDVEA